MEFMQVGRNLKNILSKEEKRVTELSAEEKTPPHSMGDNSESV
jgi:hypothetical protein